MKFYLLNSFIHWRECKVPCNIVNEWHGGTKPRQKSNIIIHIERQFLSSIYLKNIILCFVLSLSLTYIIEICIWKKHRSYESGSGPKAQLLTFVQSRCHFVVWLAVYMIALQNPCCYGIGLIYYSIVFQHGFPLFLFYFVNLGASRLLSKEKFIVEEWGSFSGFRT